MHKLLIFSKQFRNEIPQKQFSTQLIVYKIKRRINLAALSPGAVEASFGEDEDAMSLVLEQEKKRRFGYAEKMRGLPEKLSL